MDYGVAEPKGHEQVITEGDSRVFLSLIKTRTLMQCASDSSTVSEMMKVHRVSLGFIPIPLRFQAAAIQSVLRHAYMPLWPWLDLTC